MWGIVCPYLGMSNDTTLGPIESCRTVHLNFSTVTVILTVAKQLKGQCHEMNNFLKALKIKSLLYRRRWFLNLFASSMSRKVIFKFLLASMKPLTNYRYFTGNRIRIPHPPTRLWRQIKGKILIWFVRPSKQLFISWHNPFKGRTYDLIESSLDRDKFMSPEEALEFGLIDKILEHPPKLGHDEKTKEEPATKWSLEHARLCCAYVYLQNFGNLRKKRGLFDSKDMYYIVFASVGDPCFFASRVRIH